MKSIEILTREHGLILQALDSLSLAQKKIETGKQPPKEFFEKALRFLRNFADKFHHFKEEYLIHIKEKRCPSKKCRFLLTYEIDKDKCNGCRECIKYCFYNAISIE